MDRSVSTYLKSSKWRESCRKVDSSPIILIFIDIESFRMLHDINAACDKRGVQASRFWRDVVLSLRSAQWKLAHNLQRDVLVSRLHGSVFVGFALL